MVPGSPGRDRAWRDIGVNEPMMMPDSRSVAIGVRTPRYGVLWADERSSLQPVNWLIGRPRASSEALARVAIGPGRMPLTGPHGLLPGDRGSPDVDAAAEVVGPGRPFGQPDNAEWLLCVAIRTLSVADDARPSRTTGRSTPSSTPSRTSSIDAGSTGHHEVRMNTTVRPALRRSIVAATFATLMAFGTLAPSTAQAAPAAPSPSGAAPTAATSIVTAPAAATTLTASASLASLTTLASGRSSWSSGQAAANRALSQVGSNYRWGSTGPHAYDCSGLTSSAWRAAGVNIPRTSRAQSNGVRSVSRSELRPGDLVFFNSPVSHVEMYVGNGRLVGASISQGRVATSQMNRRSGIVGYGRP
jgi:peptidoglycan DL-endopeptidase CwlO